VLDYKPDLIVLIEAGGFYSSICGNWHFGEWTVINVVFNHCNCEADLLTFGYWTETVKVRVTEK